MGSLDSTPEEHTHTPETGQIESASMASFPGSPLHRPYPKVSDCLSPSCFRTQLHAGVKAAAAEASSAVRDKGSSGSERGKGSCDGAYAGSVSEPPWGSSYGGTATAHAQIHVPALLPKHCSP